MGQVFYKLFYHIVWRTKHNQQLITPEIEKVIYPFFRNKAKRFKSYIHEVDGIEDHVHMAITIPPAFSISDIVGKLKGSASYFLNQELAITKEFSWQDGFGVFSFAENDLDRILKYVRNQKEHHKTGNLIDDLERVEFDEGFHAIP